MKASRAEISLGQPVRSNHGFLPRALHGVKATARRFARRASASMLPRERVEAAARARRWSLAALLRSEPWIERVAQRVAEEIEREHGQADGQPREHGHPRRRLR